MIFNILVQFLLGVDPTDLVGDVKVMEKSLQSFVRKEESHSTIQNPTERRRVCLSLGLWEWMKAWGDRIVGRKYPKCHDINEQKKAYIPPQYYQEDLRLRALVFGKKKSSGGMSASEVRKRKKL